MPDGETHDRIWAAIEKVNDTVSKLAVVQAGHEVRISAVEADRQKRGAQKFDIKMALFVSALSLASALIVGFLLQ